MGRSEKVSYEIHALDTSLVRKNAFMESATPLSVNLSDASTNLVRHKNDSFIINLKGLPALFFEENKNENENPFRDPIDPFALQTGVIDLVLKNKSGKPVPKVSLILASDTIESLHPFAEGQGVYFKSCFASEFLEIHTDNLTDLQLQWRFCWFDIEKFEEFYYTDESLKRMREAQPSSIRRRDDVPVYKFSYITRCQEGFAIGHERGLKTGKVERDWGSKMILEETFEPKKSVHEDRIECTVLGRRDTLRSVCETMPGKLEGWEWDESWNDEWWGLRNDPSFPVYLTHKDDIEAHVKECGARVTFGPSYYVCEEAVCDAIEKSNAKTEFLYALWIFLQYGADESKKIDEWRNGGEPPLPFSWHKEDDVDLRIEASCNGTLYSARPALHVPKSK